MSRRRKSYKWIQASGVRRHKGMLRSWAAEHGFIGPSGRIELGEAYAYARARGDTHRMRQINFAKNVRRLKA
jgi:hypothetical protein